MSNRTIAYYFTKKLALAPTFGSVSLDTSRAEKLSRDKNFGGIKAPLQNTKRINGFWIDPLPFTFRQAFDSAMSRAAGHIPDQAKFSRGHLSSQKRESDIW